MGDTPAVAYAVRLYSAVLDWYKSADTKAQVIVTLDGAFLSFVASSMFWKRSEVAETIGSFGRLTWILLGLAGICLAGSISAALVCLWSRLDTASEIQGRVDSAGVGPETAWYFQHIARVEPHSLIKWIRGAGPEFEAEVLIHEVYLLAKNVEAKHRAVNWGFLLFGVTLLAFLLANATYLAGLR